MPGDPFTIRIFVPDGDSEGVRIIDRMNWTGLGLVFPRGEWIEVKKRPEFVDIRKGYGFRFGFLTLSVIETAATFPAPSIATALRSRRPLGTARVSRV
jgi:hypothetical protein